MHKLGALGSSVLLLLTRKPVEINLLAHGSRTSPISHEITPCLAYDEERESREVEEGTGAERGGGRES